MTLQYTVRPISDRTAFLGKHHSSPFSASWSDTIDLLEREVYALSGRRVVIEADVNEQDKLAAKEREARDETDTPTDIADAAAKRAKNRE